MRETRKDDADSSGARGHRHPRPRPGRYRFSARVILFRSLLLTVAVVLGAVLHLSIVGLPRPLKKRVVDHLRQRGLNVQVGRVRLDWLDGIVAHDVQLYAAANNDCPALEADEVSLRISLPDWMKGRPLLAGIGVREAVFRAAAEGGVSGLRERDSKGHITVSHIHARVDVERGGLSVRDLAADVLGIGLSGSGFVALPAQPLEVPWFEAWTGLFIRREPGGKAPAWVRLLVEELNDIEFGQRPEGKVEFTLHPTVLASNAATVVSSGRGTYIRGQYFDAWAIEARLEGSGLALSRAVLRQGDTGLEVSGALDFETEEAVGKVLCNLPPECLFSLVPLRWCDALESRRIRPEGKLELEAAFGPAPYRRLVSRVAGTASLRKANLCGAWVEEATIPFSREGGRLEVAGLTGLLGEGGRQGSLRGSIVWDFEGRTFTGDAEAAIDPAMLRAFMTSNQAAVAQSIVCEGRPPRVTVEFSGGQGGGGPFRLNGMIEAEDFSFRGAGLDSFTSDLSYDDGVLTFGSFHAVRPEGKADGRVVLDLARGMVDVDVTSSIDPRIIGMVIGPAVQGVMDRFVFRAPTYVVVRGTLDYRERKDMDLTATVEARDVEAEWFTVDRCFFEVAANGERFELRDMVGEAHGGRFQCHGLFYPVEGDPNLRYECAGSVTGFNFRTLVQDFKEIDDTDPFEGLVDGEGSVAGFIGEGRCSTVVGLGRVCIRKGRLFRIPLLGGLARALSSAYPGFSFLSETDFSADFTLEGCKGRTENARIEGPVVRVEARGDYHFDTSLDFDMDVRLLRRSGFASLLNFATFPLKLFSDIHLGGHVATPNWRPRYLPKELFLKFD